MRIIILLSVITLNSLLSAFAQPAAASKSVADSDDDPYEHKSYFMYGLNCLSDNVYLGRKDSVTLPYISPYIGYHFANGLYGKALASYAPTHSRIDLLTIEAGYDHSFGEHFNAGISGDKFYYNKNSSSIRSSTTGSVGINGQYTNEWMEPQVSWDFNFNKSSTDYVAGIQLDHDFSLAKGTFHILPTIGMNSGTQYYYDEYFVNKLNKKNKTTKSKKVVANPGHFVPLDYEISTKITYRITKWLFTLIPLYAVPVSPATITIPEKKQIVTEKEKLTNSFFVELDICHR